MSVGTCTGPSRVGGPGNVAILAAGAALLLSACPIPQPIPGVGSTEGSIPITPPRVVAETAYPLLTPTAYGPSSRCPGGALFHIVADVIDENATELVEVRWFVDYDPSNQPRRTPLQVQTLQPPTVDPFYLRVPDPFPFHPSDFDVPVERVHVVEMAVSNGFLPVGAAVPPGSLPNRTAAPGYAVQLFRWTYYPDPAGSCGP